MTSESVRWRYLGHAVEIPSVGHIRQQVAVVDRVAVQTHTLGLDQQDDIWRGASNASAVENPHEKQTSELTIQQVFEKILRSVFHTRRISIK